MKNINRKTLFYVLAALFVATYGIIYSVQGGGDITIKTTLKIIPKVVALEVAVVALFSAYLWKFRIFKGWLVPFPNLNGTWKGEILTTWVDPISGQRPGPIPAVLTIHQNFFNISCVMRTAEMTSHCVSSDFILDEPNQIKQLSYTYNSSPKATVRDRSAPHFGTMVFNIDEESKELKGEYWTSRKTTGAIEMKFWKRKKYNNFPDKMGDHPVSKIRP